MTGLGVYRHQRYRSPLRRSRRQVFGAVAFVPDAPEQPTVGTLLVKVPLTWADVDGATGYKVYRDAVLIGTSATASYDDFVAVGTYAYTVKATAAGGDSPASPSRVVVARLAGETVTVS